MPYSNKFINQQVKIFEKEEFGKVRVVIIEGQPWFVAKDICKSLEISNPSQALSRLDDDEKGSIILNEGTSERGGSPVRAIINEYGLYNLILGSRKIEAKQFKRWITHDVIPEIRRTGSYNLKQPSYLIEDEVKRARRWAEEREAYLIALKENEIMAPKAEHFDIAMDSSTLITMKETSDTLNFCEVVYYTTKKGEEKSRLKGIGRNKLFQILRDNNILNQGNEPYQKFINKGYFKRVINDVETKNGAIMVSTTCVTQRGFNFIRKLLLDKGFVPRYKEEQFWNSEDLEKVKYMKNIKEEPEIVAKAY